MMGKTEKVRSEKIIIDYFFDTEYEDII